MKRALVVISILLATTIAADAAEFVRADVYFRGWFTERAVAIGPEGLRDEARHAPRIIEGTRAFFGTVTARITSASELHQLLGVLDLPRLRPEGGDPRRDTYLAVDLFDSHGVRTTY